MSRISPRVDIAFKKIFGVEENKDLLISLINSVVGSEDQVSDVTLLNPYNLKNFKTDKLSKKYEQKYREEGREEGRIEGEDKKAIEIAQNLFKMRLSIEIIIESTGLSKEEIEKLKL